MSDAGKHGANRTSTGGYSKGAPERTRRWCGTLNNPTSDEAGFFRCRAPPPSSIRAMVAQVEKGETGTVHMQFYVEFHAPKNLRQAKSILGDRVHIEPAAGTAEQNKHYCTKPTPGCKCKHCVGAVRLEGPWEFGEFGGGQGERTDLQEAAEIIVNGGTIRDIDPALIVKYSNGFRALAAMRQEKTRDLFMCITIVGPPGIGKSHLVRNTFLNIPTFNTLFGNGGIWFQEYSGQKVIVIDEYKGQIQLQKLLGIADKWPIRLECKGGSFAAEHELLILISNSPPSQWYLDKDGTRPAEIQALYRRTGYVEGGMHNLNYVEVIDDPNKTLEEKREDLAHKWQLAIQAYKRFRLTKLVEMEEAQARSEDESGHLFSPPPASRRHGDVIDPAQSLMRELDPSKTPELEQRALWGPYLLRQERTARQLRQERSALLRHDTGRDALSRSSRTVSVDLSTIARTRDEEPTIIIPIDCRTTNPTGNIPNNPKPRTPPFSQEIEEIEEVEDCDDTPPSQDNVSEGEGATLIHQIYDEDIDP